MQTFKFSFTCGTQLTRIVFGIFLVVSLAGCAAKMAFSEGKTLIAQSNHEDGLAKLKFATQNDPENKEYRRVYLQAKEKIIYSLSSEIENAIILNQFNMARKLQEKIQNIEPNNDFAKLAIQKIEFSEKKFSLLSDAVSAIEKKEAIRARGLLLELIKLDPAHSKAKVLLASISDSSPQNQQDNRYKNSLKKNITIEFKDAPLRQVFELISRNSGLNFIFDKDVRTDQRTSIFLKNSTIESAIQFALLTNQLSQQMLDGNSILIYPNTPAKQKDYQEMVVKSFFLTNVEAKKIEKSLKMLLKTRDIVIDEKLNMLIMRDSPEAIRMAEKIVALHDVAEPEVMLEVEILEVKRTRILDLGIQWPNSLSLTPLSGTAGVLTLRDLKNNLNESSLGVGLGSATIKAKKEDGDANLLANPRIRAKNREKAHVLIGERVPNITTTATSTGFVSESINYIDVGLKLDVEPTVYLDNDVGIKVSLEVSSITNQLKTQSGSVAYQIGTRTASTVLRLKNGETQVLAGLINDEERQSANKIPGLGDLPLLGRLFGGHTNDNQKTEIILSITPRLIRNIQVPDESVTRFSSGTESAFRTNSDNEFSSTINSSSLSNPEEKLSIVQGEFSHLKKDQLNNQLGNMMGNSSLSSVGGVVNNVPGAAKLQWQGPREVKIGDSFSVQLIVQSDQAIASLPLSLGFNPQFFQVVSVSEGIFLKQGGAQTNFSLKVDPKGIVTISNSRTVGGASSPGAYATIMLRAIAPIEMTPIQLISIDPIGVGGRSLPAPQIPPLLIEIKP